jgi:hypothetical protein
MKSILSTESVLLHWKLYVDLFSDFELYVSMLSDSINLYF